MSSPVTTHTTMHQCLTQNCSTTVEQVSGPSSTKFSLTDCKFLLQNSSQLAVLFIFLLLAYRRCVIVINVNTHVTHLPVSIRHVLPSSSLRHGRHLYSSKNSRFRFENGVSLSLVHSFGTVHQLSRVVLVLTLKWLNSNNH